MSETHKVIEEPNARDRVSIESRGKTIDRITTNYGDNLFIYFSDNTVMIIDHLATCQYTGNYQTLIVEDLGLIDMDDKRDAGIITQKQLADYNEERLSKRYADQIVGNGKNVQEYVKRYGRDWVLEQIEKQEPSQ